LVIYRGMAKAAVLLGEGVGAVCGSIVHSIVAASSAASRGRHERTARATGSPERW